jgi:hypothetical protein
MTRMEGCSVCVAPAKPDAADGAMSFRVILTTGLAILYLAVCLAALLLLATIWNPAS